MLFWLALRAKAIRDVDATGTFCFATIAHPKGEKAVIQ